jgi:predicted amidohydrolase
MWFTKGLLLMPVKIALVQQPATDHPESNRARGLRAAEEAIAQGANIVCYSELAFLPFLPQDPATPEKLRHAEPIPGPTTEMFCKKAKDRGVVFILNLFERDGEHTYDSSPVIDADGRILGVTRMVHITDYEWFHEQGYYTPGDRGAPVYDTGLGKIGVAICYDRHFPEYMRALALAGAELVVIPQAGAVDEWPNGIYEAEMQVTAFQNGYFTALCSRVGKEQRLTFAGESFVCDPSGAVIARAAKGTEQTLLCDIDLGAVEKSHARILFLRDRRPDIYRAWST